MMVSSAMGQDPQRAARRMDLTTGTKLTVTSTAAEFASVASISATLSVMCYKDGSGDGKCAMLDSSSGFTAATAFSFATTSTGSIEHISASYTFTGGGTAMGNVCYSDGDNSGYGSCTTCLYSYDYCSADVQLFNSGGTAAISLAQLTPGASGVADTSIVCYENTADSKGKCRHWATVANGFGVELEFNAGTTDYISAARLSDTEAIVCYRDGGNSNYGTCRHLTKGSSSPASSVILTAGTATVFISASVSYISVAALSSSIAMVCYRNEDASGRGSCTRLSVSSTTITAGGEHNVLGGSSTWITVTGLSSTRALACYAYSGGGGCQLLTLDGSVVEYDGTPATTFATFDSSTVSYLSVNDNGIVCYREGGNSNYGTCHLFSDITPGAAGDPHVRFAHGGTADFRGSHRAYYAFLSSPGYQFAPYFQVASRSCRPPLYQPPWCPLA